MLKYSGVMNIIMILVVFIWGVGIRYDCICKIYCEMFYECRFSMDVGFILYIGVFVIVIYLVFLEKLIEFVFVNKCCCCEEVFWDILGCLVFLIKLGLSF